MLRRSPDLPRAMNTIPLSLLMLAPVAMSALALFLMLAGAEIARRLATRPAAGRRQTEPAR